MKTIFNILQTVLLFLASVGFVILMVSTILGCDSITLFGVVVFIIWAALLFGMFFLSIRDLKRDWGK